MLANPIYPRDWDPPGGPHNAMFDVGARVKYIGPSLSFLPYGSLGTVHSITVNVGDNGNYLTYNVRFDGLQQVYWVLASELTSGYQTNPIYPAEWKGSPQFKVGDRFIVISGISSYSGQTGTITKVLDTSGTVYRYEATLDEDRRNKDFSKCLFLETSIDKINTPYKANPIYDAEWGPRPQFIMSQNVWFTTKDGRSVMAHISGIHHPTDMEYRYDIFLETEQRDKYNIAESRLSPRAYGNNPIFPTEWGDWKGRHPYAVGDIVEIADDDGSITADSEYFAFMIPLLGKRGRITRVFKVTLGGMDRYRYNVMLDGEVESSNFRHSHLKKVSYNTNPIYPEQWPPEFKMGDRVQIKDGSTWSEARERLGVVLKSQDDGWVLLNLDTGRNTWRRADDLRHI